MKRGKTEVETLKLNGWGVGDILEGRENDHTDRIKITAVGEEVFCCRWDYRCTGIFSQETGNTTLSCREWRKVGFTYKPLSRENSIKDLSNQVHFDDGLDDDLDDDQNTIHENDIFLLQKIDSYLTVISDEERKHVDNMIRKFKKYGKEMKISDDECCTLLELDVRLSKSTIEGRKRV